jgi:alkanesulfonate monooxygenase SsuD/methylene tetrahydromethanopterin reductase-like flavin-dependent oxidoreductase (luciferase family)
MLVGGGGERKTLRIVATYADACNFIGDAQTVAHKVEVLRGHCEAVGRNPADIEVTALTMVASDESDEILREAEALSSAGAHALVVRSTGPEPSRWLEETWAPVVPRLADIA